MENWKGLAMVNNTAPQLDRCMCGIWNTSGTQNICVPTYTDITQNQITALTLPYWK